MTSLQFNKIFKLFNLKLYKIRVRFFKAWSLNFLIQNFKPFTTPCMVWCGRCIWHHLADDRAWISLCIQLTSHAWCGGETALRGSAPDAIACDGSLPVPQADTSVDPNIRARDIKKVVLTIKTR